MDYRINIRPSPEAERKAAMLRAEERPIDLAWAMITSSDRDVAIVFVPREVRP